MSQGTLQFSGASGANSGAGAYSISNGATLILDNTSDNNSNRINNSSAITVTGGGSLIYKGSTSGNSTETVGVINVGVSNAFAAPGTITLTYGGANISTLTSGSFSRAIGGSVLVNGVNLGKDTASTASVSRLILTSAPTLSAGTADAGTGINSSVKNAKIVAYALGEATQTTGGLGTATGTANTFLTYNAGSGLRPLNPTDEFTNNAITAGNNTYITADTSAATSAAINSLVINGGDLSIADSQTLTNTSGALLFVTSNAIKPSGTSGALNFGNNAEGIITVNPGVSATISSAITGNGTSSLTKQGAGTLTLSGNNTYTGATSMVAGTLILSGSNISTGSLSGLGGEVVVTSANALPAANVFSGGTLSTSLASITLGSNIQLNSGVSFGSATNTGNITLTGTLSSNSASARIVTVASGVTLTLNGTISNANNFGLNFNGAGTVVLNTSNPNASTYNVSAGTVVFNAANLNLTGCTVSAGTAIIGNNAAFGSGVLTVGLATIQASTDLSGASAIRNNWSSAGNMTFSGSNNITLSGTFAGLATQGYSITSSLTDNKTLVLSAPLAINSGANNKSLSLFGTGNTTISGNITNGGTSTTAGLSITNSGVTTLSGTNSYSGTTTVSAGMLVFSNTNAKAPGTVTATSGSTAGIGLGVGGASGYTSSNVDALFANTLTGFTMSAQTNHSVGIDTSAGDFIYATNQSAAMGLTKLGANTLSLTGNNSYTGKTIVQSGMLSFNTGNASATGSQALGANANVDLGVASSSSGILNYTGAAGTLAKNVNALGNGINTIQNSGTGLLTLSGTLTKAGTVLALNGGSNGINVTGLIQGNTGSPNSDLYITGGLVTLSAANSYYGPTYVNSGTLALGVSNAIPSNSALTLGSGTSVGVFNMAGYTNAIGSLAFGAGGGTVLMAANQTTTAQLSASSSAVLGTTNTLDLTGMSTGAGLYKLIAGTSLSGTFATVTGLDGAYALKYGTVNANELDLQHKATIGTISATPAATAIIVGGTTGVTVTGSNSAPTNSSALSFTATAGSNMVGSATGSATAGSLGTSGSGLNFTSNTKGLAQSGAFTVTDANATNSGQTGSVTVDVLGHSNAALAVASGNNQTIITGGSLGTVGLSLTNVGTTISGLDVNTLSNLSGTTGANVVAAGGSASYNATGFDTTTVGANKTLAVSLKAGDQQSLSGASALTTQSQNITYNVLDHSNAALSVASGNNQRVIVGNSATATLNLSNEGSNRAALDVNTLSAGLSGTIGGAVIASGGSANYTATLSTGSTGLGLTQSFSLKAGDPQNLSGANALAQQSASVTVDVLTHSAASFDSATLITTKTFDLGSYKTTSTGDQSFTLGNVFNFGDALTARLDFAGVSITSDSSDATHLITLTGGSFASLVAGDTTGSGNFLASFNTNGLAQGTYTEHFMLTFADEAGVVGGTTNNLVATLEFQVVPEPSTWAMLVGGFGMLIGAQRIRRRSRI